MEKETNTREELAQEIKKSVNARIFEAGRNKNLSLKEEDLNQDLNLYTSGVLDSFDLYEFLLNLEQDLNIEIDISDLDPEEFTNYSKLIHILLNSRLAARNENGAEGSGARL